MMNEPLTPNEEYELTMWLLRQAYNLLAGRKDKAAWRKAVLKTLDCPYNPRLSPRQRAALEALIEEQR